MTPEPRLRSAWGGVGAAVKEAVEEILHGVILIVGLRAALAGGLLALEHLRGGDVHHGGLHLVHNARKCICGRNGVWHSKRSRGGAGESKTFRRGNPARDERADQDSHEQSEG